MNKRVFAGIAALCMIYLNVPVSAESTPENVPVQSEAVSAQNDRIYCVGSVSKVYSAAAVMQLADQGKIDIDAPVTDYIPDFSMADERYKDITVRMLLDHTSGIMGSCGINWDLYDDNDSCAHDELIDFLSHQRLKADPGEYAAYCNTGFVLLEIIVENVSGMSFTEYIRKNISAKIGAEHTFTAADLPGSGMSDMQVPLYRFGSVLYDYEYLTAIGTGGVYATAPDLADLGSAFFTGNDVLLSEEAKAEMSARWTDDEELEGYGLGWDFVEDLRYEKAGIKVVGKGGDVTNMHAQLLVAPDEEISVAVLTAGGMSTLDQLMAESLLDIALEECGKEVEDLTPPEPQMSGAVPGGYEKYAGLYFIGSMKGINIYSLTFDGGMMYRQEISTGRSETEKYRYTADGSFVKVNDNGKLTADREMINFSERNGRVYIRAERFTEYPGLGIHVNSTYAGEKMEENAVSDSIQQSFGSLGQSKMVLYNEKYSSQKYEDPFIRIVTDDAFRGYMLGTGARGSIAAKMEDETHAFAFTAIPSDMNRDISDITLTGKTLADGAEIISFDMSSGENYRSVDSLLMFTKDITEIKLTSGEASWYRIGSDSANSTMTAERPEKSSILVYNRFGEMVWTTHLKGISSDVPLPADGYIVFLGETGDSMKIYR